MNPAFSELLGPEGGHDALGARRADPQDPVVLGARGDAAPLLPLGLEVLQEVADLRAEAFGVVIGKALRVGSPEFLEVFIQNFCKVLSLTEIISGLNYGAYSKTLMWHIHWQVEDRMMGRVNNRNHRPLPPNPFDSSLALHPSPP